PGGGHGGIDDLRGALRTGRHDALVRGVDDVECGGSRDGLAVNGESEGGHAGSPVGARLKSLRSSAEDWQAALFQGYRKLDAMNSPPRNTAPRALSGGAFRWLSAARLRAAAAFALGCALAAWPGQKAGAELPNDPMASVQSLPATASPHWMWVNDIVFSHMASGKAMLVDGDSGHFLGELDVGFGSMRVVPALDGKVIFSPETYFSRGTRGDRTDVVTLYDPMHLAPIGEIVIPPKRSS